MQIAQSKFAVTEAIKDIFLPIVSASTEVGSSNNRIHNVAAFDISIISNVFSQVY